MAAEQAITRARAFIGLPFRLHGRDPATGLDCVGLVALALDVRAPIPSGYPMRGGVAERYAALIDGFASRRVGAPIAGDAVLITSAAQQFHLGLWSGTSLIHAHAGLRRVVETPGPITDPIIAAWRPKDSE